MRTRHLSYDIEPLPVPHASHLWKAVTCLRLDKAGRTIAALVARPIRRAGQALKARVRTFRYAHNRRLALHDGERMRAAEKRGDVNGADYFEDRQSVHRQKAKRFEGENR